MIEKNPIAKIIAKSFLSLFTLLLTLNPSVYAKSETLQCSLKVENSGGRVVFDEIRQVQLNDQSFTPVFFDESIHSLMLNGAGRIAFLAKLTSKTNAPTAITGGMYAVSNSAKDSEFLSNKFKTTFKAESDDPMTKGELLTYYARMNAASSSNNGTLDLFVISDSNFKVNFKCD